MSCCTISSHFITHFGSGMKVLKFSTLKSWIWFHHFKHSISGSFSNLIVFVHHRSNINHQVMFCSLTPSFDQILQAIYRATCNNALSVSTEGSLPWVGSLLFWIQKLIRWPLFFKPFDRVVRSSYFLSYLQDSLSNRPRGHLLLSTEYYNFSLFQKFHFHLSCFGPIWLHSTTSQPRLCLHLLWSMWIKYFMGVFNMWSLPRFTYHHGQYLIAFWLFFLVFSVFIYH